MKKNIYIVNDERVDGYHGRVTYYKIVDVFANIVSAQAALKECSFGWITITDIEFDPGSILYATVSFDDTCFASYENLVGLFDTMDKAEECAAAATASDDERCVRIFTL